MTTEELIKKTWPGWEVDKQIGRGAYGNVYKVSKNENSIEMSAAVKVISIPFDSWEIEDLKTEGYDEKETGKYLENIVNNVINEIKILTSLRGSSNIVRIEDYSVVPKENEIGWTILIRMELLTPLSVYICDKTLSQEDVIRLGTDILDALVLCEENNIIHRDIKPENIFVNEFGVYKLGDFGIARELESLSVSMSQKGTYGYIAPEVLNGVTYDSTVDIYSLGIVMYRLLNNNRLPFLDPDKQILGVNERREATERRLNGEELPAPVNADDILGKIVLKACSFDPLQRYENAVLMKEDLLACAEGKTVNVSIKHKNGGKNRVWKKIIISGSAVLGAVLIIAGVLFAKSFVENKRSLNEKKKLYSQSVEAMNMSNYDVAMYGFMNLEDYRDSKELLSECIYLKACDFENKKYMRDAYNSFSQINDYKDANEHLLKCALYCGADCIIENDYTQAEEFFNEVIFNLDFFKKAYKEEDFADYVPMWDEEIKRQIDTYNGDGIPGMRFNWYYADDLDNPFMIRVSLTDESEEKEICSIAFDENGKMVYPDPEFRFIDKEKKYYDTYSK